MKTRLRLFLLAILVMATTLSVAPATAARCVPEMCFEVDLHTTCCYDEHCSLTCWSW